MSQYRKPRPWDWRADQLEPWVRPYADKLIALLPFWDAGFNDISRGAWDPVRKVYAVKRNSGATITPVNIANGIAMETTSGAGAHGMAYTDIELPLKNLTWLGSISATGFVGTPGWWGVDGVTAEICRVWTTSTPGMGVDFGGQNGKFRLTYNFGTLNTIENMGGTCGDGGIKLFRNGAKVASKTVAVTRSSGGSGYMGVGTTCQINNSNGFWPDAGLKYPILALFNEELPEPILARLTNDPFVLLRKYDRAIIIPAAAAVNIQGSGTAALTVSASANATRTRSAAGTAVSTFSASANATRKRSAAGTAALTVLMAADATVTTPALQGTGTAALTVSASADATKKLSASGTATTTVSVAANASRTRQGTGTATSVVTVSGAATRTRQGTGQADIVVLVSADATIPAGGTTFQGTGTCVTSVTASANALKTSQGTGFCLTSVNASASALRTTQGVGQSSLSVEMSGNASRRVQGTGSASATVLLDSSADVVKHASGTSTVAVSMSGDGTKRLQGTGTASVIVEATGRISLTRQGRGSPSVRGFLSGNATIPGAAVDDTYIPHLRRRRRLPASDYR